MLARSVRVAAMSESAREPMWTQAASARTALMLRLWEVISAERELPGVLATLADVLAPLMPFDSVGIVDFSTIGGKSLDEGPHRMIALHVVGIAQLEGESAEEFAKRLLGYTNRAMNEGRLKPLVEVRPLVP